MSDFIESMAFYGDTPWHGKGVKLDHTMTPDEAIKTAGLDWRVSLQAAELQGVPVKGYNFVIREDTGAPLGIVKGDYRAFQNWELFDIFAPLAGEHAFIHTAGSLKGGQRVWFLAKLPGELYVVKDDRVDNYLLGTTSHDGSTEILFLHTPIRVVCWNTLEASLRGDTSRMVSIRHTESAQQRVKDASIAMGLAVTRFEEVSQFYRVLANTQVGATVLNALLRCVLPSPKEDKDGKASAIVTAARDEISRLYNAEINNLDPDFTHTAWTALNAVTHFIDHNRKVRGDGDRLYSSLFATGQAMRQRAVDFLTKLVK